MRRRKKKGKKERERNEEGTKMKEVKMVLAIDFLEEEKNENE